MPVSEEVPLYIRWSPDRSTYGIELRLDLVGKIAAQVSTSDQLGTELGGFLIGSLPTTNVPTIRIDDIEMVSNGSDDDTVFLPEPSEYQKYPAIRGRARTRDAAIVGFFRSHARIGPMRPSPADRSILAQEFKDRPYVVLLIKTKKPHTAAFFVAANGQLPQEPSVREFEFEENEFKALPEVPVDNPHETNKKAPWRMPAIPAGKLRPYATIGALLVIAAVACAFMWSFANQAAIPRWLGSTNQLHLAVAPENGPARRSLLRITWDHSASELNQVSGATLVIVDGALRSELPLGLDELRLGAVDYQGTNSRVNVQMMLNTPEGQTLGDSAEWIAQ